MSNRHTPNVVIFPVTGAVVLRKIPRLSASCPRHVLQRLIRIQLPEIHGQYGLQQRLETSQSLSTLPLYFSAMCGIFAVAGRRGRIIAADGVLDRPQLKMIQNVGGDFSTFYRTLMQEAFAKSAVNGLSKKERFRLEDKAN